ncbi:FAD-dependent oxidoreductase [Alteromonas sp. C1M14]|uniref:NAD(P)/FAD-dependent oxidoreductase n=1 Tax=Alteromonas sp. C1M14 TaxID=2841567 RepID=UPI001C08B098|nr:FAD-dependent oxidoreductase [Alteromonas sp. C1M14]MBU2979053.1 FAD-dependent oxidoreductase [Alteromonas sp. C1M14]
MQRRIAIIGTGISGLTCGYLLNKRNQITVYEANDYIGGHTATKEVDVDGTTYPIDTGFIVFNEWTYPRFIQLMNKLGVKKQATEMSFSVRSEKSGLEYNGNNLNTLFAQRRNLFKPAFWRLVKDILAFNKACKLRAAEARDTDYDITLVAYIQSLGLSDDFADYYLYPMCAAIWSASLAQTKQFPLAFFLQFFNNHGLLNVTDRPQWYTLVGGSSSYIPPLTQAFAHRIHLSSPVQSVEKTPQGWQVNAQGRPPEHYDDVIFACHSDQALAMLKQPTAAQQHILGAIPYANNDVVLHLDTSVLPRRKLAWASWNYRLKESDDEQHAPAAVSYNMNILQCLENAPHTFCVTLNNTDAIEPSKILRQYQYAHPQYSANMVAAQQQREDVCGVDNLHFCGAYWYNGFHEDGVRSALDVCARFGETL